MNNKSKIIIASIVSLGVITGGILVSGKYTAAEVRIETVIIEEEYESNKINNENKGEINVGKIDTVPINCIGWLDDENVLVFENNYKRECFIRKYNIKSGQYDLTYKPGIVGQNAYLSPDKSKIFICNYNSKEPEIGKWGNQEFLNYMYDLKSNTTTKIDSSGMFEMWSEDSSVAYLCKRQSFRDSENDYKIRKVGNEFYDVDNNKIFKSEKLDKLTTDRPDNDNYFYDVYLIKDKSKYLVKAIDVDEAKSTHEFITFEIDNNTKGSDKKLFKGQIWDSESLDDTRIVFSGYNFYNQGKYEQGLYMFDKEKNQLKQLLSSNFNMGLETSDNKQYIALDDGRNNIYIARIEDNEIKDKTLVLKSDYWGSELFFSPDNNKLIVNTKQYDGKSYIIYLED